MPSTEQPRLFMKCPKCKNTVTYGDIFIQTLQTKLTIGSATKAVLEPCGCSATSGDPEFLEMLQIIEAIADPGKQLQR